MVKSEFVLGLIGGLLGLLVSGIIIAGSSFLLAFSGMPSSNIAAGDIQNIKIYGGLLLLVSFIGIVGADFADFDLRLGGKMMILCAVVGSLIAGFASIPSIYLPSALFLVIGGIMALVRHSSTEKEVEKRTVK